MTNDPRISRVERGPDLGGEIMPSWTEILDSDDGYGQLSGVDFAYWAGQDFDGALTMLHEYMADLPEDRIPQSLDGIVDCVSWATPEDRESFVAQFASWLEQDGQTTDSE